MRRLWTEVARLRRPRGFANAEGGSVEQQRDQRLLLHHCANYAAVLSLLRGIGRRLRLLELGCGSGALSCAFARVMPDGWELVATDYSAALIAHARANYRQTNLRFEQLDVREAGLGRIADRDAVLMLEVIEHLSADVASGLLHGVHRQLRSGARFVITTLDRSAYSRPFSGYPPHVVEYSFRSIKARLADSAWNPFRRFTVYRLVSPRITEEAVRAEDRFGYVLNRLNRLAVSLCVHQHEVERLRQRVAASVFRVYSGFPRNDKFDLESYLRTLRLTGGDAEAYDRSSFGLVLELVKE
ncbi:MAG: class I SAM-dependent methyltransferase [candidate division WOR-3 bacterium]